MILDFLTLTLCFYLLITTIGDGIARIRATAESKAESERVAKLKKAWNRNHL